MKMCPRTLAEFEELLDVLEGEFDQECESDQDETIEDEEEVDDD